MKNLNEMSLDEKILELIQAVTRAKMNQDYKSQVILEDESELDEMMGAAKMAQHTFNVRIFDMDPRERERALIEYTNILDAALSCFPEYEKTSSVKMSM